MHAMKTGSVAKLLVLLALAAGALTAGALLLRHRGQPTAASLSAAPASTTTLAAAPSPASPESSLPAPLA
jgi:hypothetical protein